MPQYDLCRLPNLALSNSPRLLLLNCNKSKGIIVYIFNWICIYKKEDPIPEVLAQAASRQYKYNLQDILYIAQREKLLTKP